MMMLANPPAGGSRFVRVVKTEEKGSDVNLATLLLIDAFDNDFEAAAIITNDSDLTLPIRLVRAKFGADVGVLNPHPNTSHALRLVASFYRPIRAGALAQSQFPPTLTDAHGTITKPASW